MTLILAFKCRESDGTDAILVTADSRVSGGRTMTETNKLIPILRTIESNGNKIETDLALVSGAGDGAIVMQLIRIVEKLILDYYDSAWGQTYPTFDQFEEAMQEVQYKFMQYLQSFEKMDAFKPFTTLLVCSLDSTGTASMYVFDHRGVYIPVHDTPGFACLGGGLDTGGSMILKQFWNKNLDSDSILKLSAYTMEMVSTIDPSVGSYEGSSYYYRLVEGTPVFGGPMEDYMTTTVENVAIRKSLLKMIWNLCDILGEETILTEFLTFRSHLANIQTASNKTNAQDDDEAGPEDIA